MCIHIYIYITWLKAQGTLFALSHPPSSASHSAAMADADVRGNHSSIVVEHNNDSDR